MKLSGSKIRAARKAAGLRVEDLAYLTGIAHATLVRAEGDRNVMSAERLMLVARALDVSMESLFEEEAPVGGGRAR